MTNNKSTYTSEQRHQDWLREDIDRLLLNKHYLTEELEIIHKVILNIRSINTVINILKGQ